MIAKIAPVDSQKRWNEKFLDTVKDLDSAEASLKNSCQQLNYGMVISLLLCTYSLCNAMLYYLMLYYVLLYIVMLCCSKPVHLLIHFIT
jgi:sugar phosphate permease